MVDIPDPADTICQPCTYYVNFIGDPPDTMTVSTKWEAALGASGAQYVLGIDEVGRGALAGPLAVGVCAVPLPMRPAPDGLRDSKQLSPAARQRLLADIDRWTPFVAVGWASPAEIVDLGVTEALRRATHAALATLPPLPDACILLDGSVNFLSDIPVPVTTLVRGDQHSATIAAASIAAKVARDDRMTNLSSHYPWYSWQRNKGYASAAHRHALQRWGPSPLHRWTWLSRITTQPVTHSWQ